MNLNINVKHRCAQNHEHPDDWVNSICWWRLLLWSKAPVLNGPRGEIVLSTVKFSQTDEQCSQVSSCNTQVSCVLQKRKALQKCKTND